MGIIDRIKGNPLKLKLTRDELTAERIRLKAEEKRTISEVERLSAEKKDLFNSGFQSNDREKPTLVLQIQQLYRKVKLENIYLKKISDQINVVDNLIYLIDNNMFDKFKDFTSIHVYPKPHPPTSVEQLKSIVDNFNETPIDNETDELLNIWSTYNASQSEEAFDKWDRGKIAKDEVN